MNPSKKITRNEKHNANYWILHLMESHFFTFLCLLIPTHINASKMVESRFNVPFLIFFVPMRLRLQAMRLTPSSFQKNRPSGVQLTLNG